MSADFKTWVNEGYACQGTAAVIGVAMLAGQPIPGAQVKLPLKMMNRHGLIAGATGTGKTKTLQMLCEQLSDQSIPVLVMDIKGDLSGLAAAGTENEKIKQRYADMQMEWKPSAYPVELLSLSDAPGVKMRATVTEFGPVLLSKILGLNDTQGGLLAILFKYSDDHQLPLLNLQDLIKLLQYAGNEGKSELEATYGKISTSSTGTILRKVIELQQQGADMFFGERSFDVNDLMRIGPDGRGLIHILRVTDLQDRPKLFSTFMLQLLAELYASAPEEGDLDQPKLVLFIDEAHLIFQEASEVLLQQIETMVKLIRSKGIGIFFCTQNPMDVPAGVLGQLGLKIQHALRAFTAADRKSIKKTAENYPESSYYQTDQLLTQLGIGEALVTLLNEKGIPTPLVHVMLTSPHSRMDILSESEIAQLMAQSTLAPKYAVALDTESAYEILTAKLQAAASAEAEQSAASKVKPKQSKPAKSTLEEVMDSSVVKQAGRTAASIITRSLLGALGLNGRTKNKSWF